MGSTRLAGYVIEYADPPGGKAMPAYLGLSADLVLGTLCYSHETAFQFGSPGQAHQFLTRFPRFDGYAPGVVREVHEVTGLNLGRCVGPDGATASLPAELNGPVGRIVTAARGDAV